MNRSDHIHAGYTGYTCIGSTIHRSIHGIDSTLVHGIHVGLYKGVTYTQIFT